MSQNEMVQEHATTIAIEGQGIMLRGPSASGKSDLALRLIDQGAELVADDRTCLDLDEGKIIAYPPSVLAGKLEVRGLGILKLPYRDSCPVQLLVDLVPMDDIERLPLEKKVTYLGVEIRHIYLCAFEISAVLKVKYALSTDWLE